MEQWIRALNAELTVESGQPDAPAHEYLASLLAEGGRLAEAEAGAALYGSLGGKLAPADVARAWNGLASRAMGQGKLEVAALFGRWAAEADPGNLQRRHNLGTPPLWSGRAREARDLGYELLADVARMAGRTDDLAPYWSELERLARRGSRAIPWAGSGFRSVNDKHGVRHRIGETATQLDPDVKMRLLGFRAPILDLLLAPAGAVIKPR